MLLTFGTAESAVTIIAVSIPILRALLYMSTAPPKPRFFQKLYEEGQRRGPQLEPLPHFGSTIELVVLDPETPGRVDGEGPRETTAVRSPLQEGGRSVIPGDGSTMRALP